MPVEPNIETVYRENAGFVRATLIRLLGDTDLAEEAVHDAFLAATMQWPRDGMPANPRAWLVSTGRFKAIDRLRRRARLDQLAPELALRAEMDGAELDEDAGEIGDDRLRLIFTCCLPELPPDAQAALTLREVCGLTTEEIAAAFLRSPPTVAQRIVRAKARIHELGLPFRVPEGNELPQRLDAVLRAIYLIFNEGYASSAGTSLIRVDLSGEAIRLGRLLHRLLPRPEVAGLLALMLFHESRRTSRTDAAGEPILPADQDRSLWDRKLIGEAEMLVDQAMSAAQPGPYALQAAIAGVHAAAPDEAATDWDAIVAHYDRLAEASAGSPVVALNRAVAVAVRDGPAAGLALIDHLLARGDLRSYRYAHAARADLLRRLGRAEDAMAAYQQALELTDQASERRFLLRRIGELPASSLPMG